MTHIELRTMYGTTQIKRRIDKQIEVEEKNRQKLKSRQNKSRRDTGLKSFDQRNFNNVFRNRDLSLSR